MSKKIKGPIEFRLGENNFCQVWEHNRKDCEFGISATSDGGYCTVLYQDGLPSLMPPGKFYPFSPNPEKKESRFSGDKVERAKIVALSCAYILKVRWGTADGMWVRDKSGKPYFFGARGVLYVQLAPRRMGGQQQNEFYAKLLSHGDASGFDIEKFRERMREAFQTLIAREVQSILESMDYDLGKLHGLTPSELLEIDAKAYKVLVPVFEKMGLTLNSLSENSIVSALHDPNQLIRCELEQEHQPSPYSSFLLI